MKNNTFLLVVFCFCLGFAACQDSEGIGADIIEGGSLINSTFVDTLTLEVSLEQRDPLALTLSQVPGSNGVAYLLGTLQDPIFGNSMASICTQITTGENDVRFDSLPTLDSVILSLAYPILGNRFTYGEADMEQNVTVYEVLDPNLSNDVEYETDYSCNLSEELGSTSFTFLDNISEVDSTTTTLKIKLKDEFGQRLLDKSLEERDTSNVFFSVNNFLKYFNGIAIVPDENNTAMGRFNLSSGATNMAMHYRALRKGSDGEIVEDTLVRYFRLRNWSTVLGTTINTFTHDFAGSTTGNILDGDGILTQKAYLKATNGLHMRVRIPHLKNLGNVIVNKAELELTNVDSLDHEKYPLPPSLLFRLSEDEDDLIALSDYEVSNPFEVITDSITGATANRYTIYMAYGIQRMLTDDGDLSLIVRIPESPLNPYRAVLTGPTHEEYPMKLKLYYTEIQ